MNKFIKTLLLLFVSVYFAGCTSHLYEKANREFDNLQYAAAIIDYNKIISKKNHQGAKIKLAHAYRLINDDSKALPLYAEIVAYPKSEPVNMLFYAGVLMSHSRYNDARVWLEKYMTIIPDDELAKKMFVSCKSINAFMRDTTLFTLKKIEFPDFTSSYAQIPYNKGIVFTADKKAGAITKKRRMDGKIFLQFIFFKKGYIRTMGASQSFAG